MDWETCVNWLEENKELLGSIAVVLPVAAVIVKYIYKFMCWSFTSFFRLRNDKETKEAYRNVENAAESKKRIIISEPIFFCEPEEKKYFFYNGLKIVDLFNRYKKIKMKSLTDKSYLIIGEAGCGKSACLKNDYLQLRKKWYLHTRIAQCFLYSNEMIELLDDEEKQNKMIDDIKTAKYKKIFLYVDGIDEIGEKRMALFYKFIEKFSIKNGNSFVLKISSRPQFASNNVERQVSKHIEKYVKVGDWNEEILQKYNKKLFQHLKMHDLKDKKTRKNLYNNIKKSTICKEYITSPLLMKLYVYCYIHGDIKEVENSIENRFTLYSSFINTLIKVYLRRKGSPCSAEIVLKEQDIFAKRVFESLSVPSKVIQSINSIESMQPLCKTVFENEVVLIHETFYEYFAARYYYNCTTSDNINMENMMVYCSNYSNDYADFITDAFKKDDIGIRRKIASRFVEIYYFTLNCKAQKALKETNISIPTYALDLKKLNELSFFSLKYEIIFRLGRLDIDEDFIVKFLEFVYYHDKNVGVKSDIEYYTTVLKRCCAISSSFVGGEKIEIDYVRRMLPYDESNYDINYDLANRTHTLIFYGDVTNVDIFRFKDDDASQGCERAMKKRIDRLAISLPNKIATMDRKTKKKYYFRLFDLATVYTFLANRNIKLKQDELEIIRRCKVDFEGSSYERTVLMQKIKEQILNLEVYIK